MGNESPWPRKRFRYSFQAIPYLEPGDLVVRPKRGGIGEHWGAVLPNGSIIEGQVGVGARETDYSDFVAPNERLDIIKPPIEFRDPSVIEYRARLVLSRCDPYDLFKKNCEHTAMFVATGRASSGQIFLLSLLVGCSAALLIIKANERSA